MVQAIELARRCQSEEGRTSPKVGAIVALDGVVIGKASRGELVPGEHAEFTLLEKMLSDEVLTGATLFTTLEPCTTRNPPKIACVERVIARRIGKVFIGTLDPNPQISGQGQLRLREAGILTALFDPDLMSPIEELNRDFLRQYRSDHVTTPTNAQTTDQVGQGQVTPTLKIEGVSWSKMVVGGAQQGRLWAWIINMTLTNDSTEDPIGISLVRLEIERDGSHMPALQVDNTIRSEELFHGVPRSGTDLGKNPYLRPRESFSGSLTFVDFVDPFSGVDSALLTLVDTAANTHEFRPGDAFLKDD